MNYSGIKYGIISVIMLDLSIGNIIGHGAIGGLELFGIGREVEASPGAFGDDADHCMRQAHLFALGSNIIQGDRRMAMEAHASLSPDRTGRGIVPGTDFVFKMIVFVDRLDVCLLFSG